jgi:hypothetical protein
MQSKELIKQILYEQKLKIDSKEFGIERNVLTEIESKIQLPHILIISGIRRCGKSTLLKQIISKYYHSENYFYINFDDERWLNFEAQDFNIIYECLLELFGSAKTFFIDEIQNIQHFESFVRRFYDDGFKFFITGSNSNLLSKELASKLTGRYLEISLFPFDFREYLSFHQITVNPNTFYNTPEITAIRDNFQNFLFGGGMPEYVRFNDTDILKQVYDDIVSKDIAIRFHLSKVHEMRELYQYLITNFGRKYSYTSLTKNISLESSISVKDYISYFELTFLGKQIYKFDYSYKKQIANDKKLYIIDNAFIPLISNATSKDKGRLLENLVFCILKKQNEVFYFFEKNECDFITVKDNKISGIYQVCYELDEQNTKRETAGLVQALEKFSINSGIILTNDQERVIETENHIINVLPVWKWILTN